MRAAVLNPAAGDWGQMVESGFGSKLLREQIEEFKIEKGIGV